MTNYWRSVFQVFSGTLVAQVILFLSMPLITRMYSPDIFGDYAEILSLAFVLSVVVFGGLERALPMLEERRLKWFVGLLLNASCLSFPIICAVSIIYLLARDSFDAVSFFLLVSLSISISLMTTTGYLAVWRSRFKLEAVSKVIQSFVLVVSQVFLGAFHKSALLLVVSEIFSRAVFSIIIVRNILSGKFFASDVGDRSEYKSFYTFGLFSSLVLSLSSNLPVIMAAWFYGAATSATLFLVVRVSTLPLSLMGNAIGRVYYAEASKLKSNPNDVKKLFVDSVSRLLKISFFVILPGVLVGSWLLPYLLGAEWEQASVYLLIMLPSILVQFVVSPISLTATVFKAQQYDAFFALLRVVSIALPFVCMGGRYDFEVVYIVVSCFSAISYFLFGLSCWKIICDNFKKFS